MARSMISLAMIAAMAAAAGAEDAGPAAQKSCCKGLPPLGLADFNRLAAQAGTGLFWYTDAKNPGSPDTDEFVALGTGGDASKFIAGGRFTPAFEAAWRRLVEMKRREVVRRELDQGLPTLVRTDLAKLGPAEKRMVSHIIKAGSIIDGLHGEQTGAAAFVPRLAAADQESRSLFARNGGPWCAAPLTEKDPFCNALPDFPARRWTTYPGGDEQNLELCKKLAALPNGRELMSPFAVVRKTGEEYSAVPYNSAYARGTAAAAAELRAAAALADEKTEGPFKKYLMAAAEAFTTNAWEAADEAWSAMNASNSAWYLRAAADEVYWDLCQEKAGFHMSFALIDKASLELQERLMPLRGEMEHMLSMLSGGAYKARDVKFKMPDFIEIILTAGDSRSPLGATIGQSLPNWGKVAAEGRGRTVVMTNLYQDPQSRKMAREKAAALLSAASMANYSDDKQTGLYDIVLHEAAHNLGPHSDYKIDGKGPSEVFGGQTASTIEELKAQTASLYYTELLRRSGIIGEETARRIYTHAIVWGFGHISQGMFAASGNPKPYSQLAAVQVGFLVEEGVLSWDVAPDQQGRPTGRFDIRYEQMVPAVEKLMQKVVRIKAAGDAAGARELIEAYVTGSKKGLVHADEIAERLLKFPRASMVYSVKL
jgi:hypothetical protein